MGPCLLLIVSVVPVQKRLIWRNAISLFVPVVVQRQSLPILGYLFVIGKTQEFEKLKMISIKVGYLNLYQFYHFMKTVSQTPNTPAVHLFYALEQALINILKKGISKHSTCLKEKAVFLRKRHASIGTNLFN